ncbi:nnf1a [Glossina fuscipes fuscipes]
MSIQTEGENKTSTHQDLAAQYDRFKDFGENARKTYEQLYREMVFSLNAAHLQPFNRALLKSDDLQIKNMETVIGHMRQKLLEKLLKKWNDFWLGSGVSESLISLEMYKEKFKEYEGKDWKMWNKSPKELTRPIRMHLNGNRIRYLQLQLDYQREQLDQVLQENVEHRKKLQEIALQRTQLLKIMEEYEKKFELDKPEILRLHLDLLDFGNESAATEIAKK